MPATTLDGHQIHVDDEGFLTEPGEWDEELATALATQIGINLTDAHWEAIRFLRNDFAAQGQTADPAPGRHRRRDPDQAAVPAVPPEAGQEDGVHRRPAQAARLRLTHIRPTKEARHDHQPRPRHAPAIVPTFDNPEQQGRKLAIICSKGSLDMAYPGLILANAALGEGVETHLFFTFWGFDIITKRHDGRPEVHDARQHRHPHAAGPRRAARDDRHGHLEAEEGDRRPRRPRASPSSSSRSSPPAATCGPAGCRPT